MRGNREAQQYLRLQPGEQAAASPTAMWMGLSAALTGQCLSDA